MEVLALESLKQELKFIELLIVFLSLCNAFKVTELASQNYITKHGCVWEFGREYGTIY